MNDVAKVTIGATAATVVVVVGVTVLWPSSSASAMTQRGSSPTAVSVGLASDLLVARQTVTEKGVRFSFRVPTTGWERFRSISTDKSAGGQKP